ncbi:MAG: hypothetical protein IT328_16340 [Caldilineaceae bacterium]|nr:hypothetical protein [Caldilineaceae bacterium]
MGATLLLVITGGCSRGDSPTRTPFPTFTPTPQGAAVASDAGTSIPAAPTATLVVAMPTATETATALPPTPTLTSAPTDTPTPQPTPTPSPLPTVEPTATLTPVPSPTPTFTFILEAAEKHPTQSLAPNVVRIFLFVADQEGFGLEGYSLNVLHNGAELAVDRLSAAGLPALTRGEPSPYTRFTNMNVIFVEAQAGTWRVQLVDGNGVAVGPAAEFELTADEITRELYVRYQQQ